MPSRHHPCSQDLLEGLSWLADLSVVTWVAPTFEVQDMDAYSNIVIQTGRFTARAQHGSCGRQTLCGLLRGNFLIHPNRHDPPKPATPCHLVLTTAGGMTTEQARNPLAESSRPYHAAGLTGTGEIVGVSRNEVQSRNAHHNSDACMCAFACSTWLSSTYELCLPSSLPVFVVEAQDVCDPS